MSTIKVTNINAGVSEKDTREFFSFCGKIRTLSIEKQGATQTATIDFEREAAAKTAVLLDNTKLGPDSVKVESIGGRTSSEKETSSASEGNELSQEDKPRTAILAEYLSHGYILSDAALEKGIEVDQKHGISQRFQDVLNSALTTAKNVDEKYHIGDRVNAAGDSYGVRGQAVSSYGRLQQYFENALNTPTGQRVRDYYSATSKQVLDIHNEARRLADDRKQTEGGAAIAHSEAAKGDAVEKPAA